MLRDGGGSEERGGVDSQPYITTNCGAYPRLFLFYPELWFFVLRHGEMFL